MGYKTYPEYNDSGAQWLGEVPAHWEVKRFKNLARLNPPKSEISNTLPDMEVQFLPMEMVSEDGKFSLKETRSLSEVYHGFTYFRDGDVIMAKITPCFENGKGAIVDNLENGIGFGSTEFHVLRPTSGFSSYIWYITKSIPFRKIGIMEMKGVAGQQRVPESFVSEFLVATPPHGEQTTIAAFLDEKTTQIDQLIEKKTRFIELLKEKRAALITEAVTGKFDVRTGKPYAEYKDSGVEWLGEVPAHWETKKLKYIGKAIIGLTYDPKEISDDGIVVLRATNIQNGFLSLDDVVRVKKQIPTELITKSGDIFICSRNGSRHLIGKNVLIGRSEEGYSFGAFTTVFRSPMNDFVYYVFNSDLFSYQSGLFMTSTVNQLTTSMLNNMEIPLPPACEQEQIVAFLHNNKRKIDQIIEKTQQSIDLLKEKRAALITAAVTGKIDVRDFNPKR